MSHLKLVSMLTGLFIFAVSVLVSFAFDDRIGIGDLFTGAGIGLTIGLGSYLSYRKRPIKGCR